MKKTKEELVKFLSYFQIVPHLDPPVQVALIKKLADKLIESGWVEVYRPREYWIRHDPLGVDKAFNSLADAETFSDIHPERYKIIHVREVE